MRVTLLLLLGCLLAGCSDRELPSQPVDATLTYSGAGTVGALVITITGGDVDSISAATGVEVVTTVDQAGRHLLITGALAPGAIATLHLPAGAVAARYVTAVEQAADGATFSLLDPARFVTKLTPVP